jgi:putative hydrolase of the HAD superfamily
MAIRAVLFDIGGVLLRTEDQAPRRRWEVKLRLAPGALAAVVFENPVALRATIGKADVEEIWQEVGRELRLPSADLAELRSDFFAGDRWDGNLLAIARKLRSRMHTGVLSNSWPGARRERAQWVNSEAFDVILYSDEVHCCKPEPEFYRMALARLGTRPAETIFFDDFEANVAAACQVGLEGVLFKSSHQVIETIRRIFINTSPL